jgi:hypothetical protein
LCSDNPDLFWALRAGGGNFGVVTEFEFALHRVGPILQLGLFLFSPDQGGDLLRFARGFVETLPDDCGVFMAGLSAPPDPFVPADLHFTPAFALAVVGLSDEQEHARLVEPIKQALDPIVELITPIPYVGLQQMFDASAPWGMHNYEKAVYLADLSNGAIDAILEHQAKRHLHCRSCRSSPWGVLTERPTTTPLPLGAAGTLAMSLTSTRPQ